MLATQLLEFHETAASPEQVQGPKEMSHMLPSEACLVAPSQLRRNRKACRAWPGAPRAALRPQFPSSDLIRALICRPGGRGHRVVPTELFLGAGKGGEDRESIPPGGGEGAGPLRKPCSELRSFPPTSLRVGQHQKPKWGQTGSKPCLHFP